MNWMQTRWTSGQGSWSRSSGRGPTGGEAKGLALDETYRVEPPRGGVEVRVLAGTVLLTQSGDRDDHVLQAGATLRLPGRGRVVMQALGAARVAVEPLAASPGRWTSQDAGKLRGAECA